MTGKAVNLGDGDGMQIPWVLHLSGIRAKVHDGDIKTADQHKMITQTHALAQAKISLKS